tara:strand:- start:993 stop:1484 length:492 start_codon:yes stop_codon:yes gene_type:complete
MAKTKKEKKYKGGPRRKSYMKSLSKVGVSDSLHHPGADYTKQGDAQDFEIAPSRFMYDGRWYTMSPKEEEKKGDDKLADGKLIIQLGKEVKEEKKEVKKEEEKKEVEKFKEEKAPPKAESSPQAWTDYYKAAIKAGYKYARNTQGKLFDLRNLGGAAPGQHSF